MTKKARLDDRPPTPLQVRNLHKKCQPDMPEAELKQYMCWALEDVALWWARKGGTPPQIAEMLAVEVKECGEPPFASPVEVRRIAAKGFRECINERKHYAEKFDAEALGEPSDISKELGDMESWLTYRTDQFHFGINALDDALNGGIMQGQMLSIIGNPGAMKTSLLLNGLERWVTESPETAALFSLDMSKADIFERLMLREMGCGRDALRDHYWRRSAEYAAAKESLGRKYKGRLSVFENQPGKKWTIDKLKEYVEIATPGLLAIDFLTLLKKPKQSDFDVANEVMPILKELSHFYGCAVVVLSQMSMESRRIQAGGGMGGSAKGGGIVEETVDAEIELFRDISVDPLDTSPRIIATIKKARMGIAGASFQLGYSGPRMEFTGMAHRVHKAKKVQPVFDTL